MAWGGTRYALNLALKKALRPGPDKVANMAMARAMVKVTATARAMGIKEQMALHPGPDKEMGTIR
jgi:hypothetical protein